MTKSFDQFETALALRDIIRGIARKVIDKERPRPRYGTLVSYNGDGTATVQFPGEAGPTIVNTGMVAPVTPGARVRIERVGNDRFLTDAYGTASVVVPQLLAGSSGSGFSVVGGLLSASAGAAITGGVDVDDLQMTGPSPLSNAIGSSPTTGTAGILNIIPSGNWAPFDVVIGRSGQGLFITTMKGENNNTSGSTLHLTFRVLRKSDSALMADGATDTKAAYVVSAGAGSTEIREATGIRAIALTPDIYTIVPMYLYSSGTPSSSSPAGGPYIQYASITYVPLL